jgi:hypothetical protein
MPNQYRKKRNPQNKNKRMQPKPNLDNCPILDTKTKQIPETNPILDTTTEQIPETNPNTEITNILHNETNTDIIMSVNTESSANITVEYSDKIYNITENYFDTLPPLPENIVILEETVVNNNMCIIF